MKPETYYRLVFSILRPIGALLYPQRSIGRENIPEGAAILCANHSSATDPVLLSFALGVRTFVHHISKIEARSIPVWGRMMERIGSIFVRRDGKDFDSMRACMKALKAGEKLVIFPEGTRVRDGETIKPKNGAVHLAARLHVPIVPIFIPRRKKPFHRVTIRIGEPYRIESAREDELDGLSAELMAKIAALGETRP